MNRKTLAAWSLGVAVGAGLAVGGFALAQDKPSASPATQPAAVDLHNTVCPVSGDQVGDCKLTEIFDGKIYHFCCPDCPAEFLKDPAKFAKKWRTIRGNMG
jgi:YHS domain-containing protein